jgi:fatty-acyl-CoA synthase
VNPFADATAASLLDTVANRHGTREAMVFANERLTYADFAARSRRLAGGLAALGVGRGDKVAIWLPNRPAWFVAQYACARLGAVVVALNPRYRSHELTYILAQAGATALILTDHLGRLDYVETLHEVIPELLTATPGELASARCPRLRHVIVDADAPYPGCHRLADLLDTRWRRRDARRPLRAALHLGDSFPKGAMIAHRNCVPHGWNCGEILKMTAADRVLHALPAAGTWGGLCIPLTTWSHGACLVLVDVFDPLRAPGPHGDKVQRAKLREQVIVDLGLGVGAPRR